MTETGPSDSDYLARARSALNDAAFAVQEVRAHQTDPFWRVRWVAAISLLRIVGHVLDKVESRQSEKHRREIEIWWNTLKSTKPFPEIFWSFIDEERNIILKEYEFNLEYYQGHAIKVGGKILASPKGILIAGSGLRMKTEPFKDQNALNLCELAMKWWDTQLTSLEEKIRSA